MLRSIEDVKTANYNAGHHFFSKDTMRFFRSRVNDDFYPTADGGGYFITSEQFVGSDGHKEPRRYTVRKCDNRGVIEPATDLTTFQKFVRLDQARKAIREAIDVTPA